MQWAPSGRALGARRGRPLVFVRRGARHAQLCRVCDLGAATPAQLAQHVLRTLHDARDAESEQTSALSASDLAQVSPAHRERIALGDDTYRVFVLTTVEDLERRLVGGVAVRQGSDAMTPPSNRLLDALARALREGQTHGPSQQQSATSSFTQG